MAKYRRLFLEEAAEHLSDISTALLALEKERGATEEIDVIFRMAHSIKSMSASLDYDSVASLAHALEDRMEGVRSRGRVADEAEMRALFRGLEGLEAMVATVRETGEAPPPQAELVESLRAPAEEPGPGPDPGAPEPPDARGQDDPLKKKVLS